MEPKELIRAGKLAEARKELVDSVKNTPGDSKARVLLFQVLSLMGDWEKAERHIDVIAAQGVQSEAGVIPYKNILQCEKTRRAVSQLKKRPDFLPKAPPYFEKYMSAMEQLAGGEVEESLSQIDRIESEIPLLSGTLDGRPFNDIRDIDAFLSFFIEAFVHERYVWIPFEAVRELAIGQPQSLFDLIWTPARITAWDGLSLNCFLPVLYPDSASHEDDRVKLGRMTDWCALGGPFHQGVGQHVYLIGDQEVPILEIRELIMNKPTTEGNPQSDD